ncbi:hypothetical protein ON010_g9427 [Phytophthora cinnamomi]|nr:hypothetical protein ON010_g9427 [Phytophthora cinnamomi]
MDASNGVLHGSGSPAVPPAPEPTDTVHFPKRKWSELDTLVLACAWCDVYKASVPKDEKTTMTTTRIFDAFKAARPSSTGSKKAVEDKLQALHEMFRFIRYVNANRISGSTGKPDWFELSKKERKELKYVSFHHVRRVCKLITVFLYLLQRPAPNEEPNVTKEVFDRLNSFLGDQADTVLLRSTYIARATFAEENAPPAESPDNASSLFEEDTHASLREQDPHNTGRRNNKWQRNDKYEKVREVLEERSEAFFAKFELMQREEMRERRRQHAE